MTIFDVLSLFCGLALFLYGMDLMGNSLKKSAGAGLKNTLSKMTASPLRGFLLGLGVTAIIQSSSATTVMVVGFVNSGTMTLFQAIGVIMGANVGTAITAWITGLSGLGAGASAAVNALKWLKPDSWMPIVAVIGIALIMFSKRGRKKDLGAILIGFSILMVGMGMMGDSVGGLKDSDAFKSILTVFGENPILGVLAGLVLTAIVQSSSASIGILQSLSTTGAITYGMAIPIILGQNIGTCVTAMISAIGANKNGKRAAVAHLYFNIIGVVFWLSAFYIVNAFANFAFVASYIDMWGIAAVHTIFKLLAVGLLFPFAKYLEKLAILTVKDKEAEDDSPSKLLDPRLIATPSIAVARATEVAATMASISCSAMRKSMKLITEYDADEAEQIRDLESKADVYEDELGSYLVKISAAPLTDADNHQLTKLLHIIGDFERISDHAVNIVESAEEIRQKKLAFSKEANRELAVMTAALEEILDISEHAFRESDLALAAKIEPLEQVVDDLKDQIKANHIQRLQKSECSIEHGFVLSDLLNNFERVSDHCSNVGGCIIELTHDALDLHKYLAEVKADDGAFKKEFDAFKEKYAL
ncbi:MAG: Na/Pi cotransporter family protein [Clostridia bacterium]|nr:Na/Pi cotransporter family protein [Clostridia bacterium]